MTVVSWKSNKADRYSHVRRDEKNCREKRLRRKGESWGKEKRGRKGGLTMEKSGRLFNIPNNIESKDVRVKPSSEKEEKGGGSGRGLLKKRLLKH